MQRILLSGLMLLAMAGGASAFVAKEPSPAQVAQAPSTDARQNRQMPNPEAAARSFTEDATGQVKGTDGRAPLENGVLPGASQDSETAPAKHSARNAEADRPAIMARPLALTDAQRRAIYERVMSGGPKQETEQFTAEPASVIPSTVALHELPPGIAEEVPVLRGYKYVKVDDRVVIVDPPNRVVVGAITSESRQ
jgi:Protein of unknown function (DUF1236)